MRRECISVFEEIEAQVEELLLQVARVEVFGRCAVVDEFSDILREAAPEVEKGVWGLGVFEEGEDAWGAGLLGDGHVEESEHADARVGSAGPCFVSLWACQ